MKLPEGKRFYGAVTVSERGQIVVPAEARRDFAIEVGDKLLVLGDLGKGIALARASKVVGAMAEQLGMFQSPSEPEEKTGDEQ